MKFEILKPMIDNLQGDLAEVGVYQGKSAKRLAIAFPDRAIHLFDTFSGMPKNDPSIDGHKEGDFADTSLSVVQEYLRDFKNIFYYPGIFPKSALSLPDWHFAFVNIDVDLCQSTKDCLAFFWPRLVEGGVLFVQDDYGARNCKGVKVAVDRFTLANGLKLKTKGHTAWIIK